MEMPEKPALSLSILVPTFNRAASLKKLLESLESLERPDSVPVELLVIDNGSTDGTAELLVEEQARRRNFPLILLHEKQRGQSNALNRGLQAAAGKIIAFLHDDVVVHPQWLVKLLECYRSTVFDALQGRVLPGLDPEGRSADPKRLREYNIPIRNLGEKVHEVRGSAGVNMSFRREVFEKVGFFNPRLGPGASGFSEDTEYCMRIRKAGLRIGYTPHAIAYHELNPARYGSAYNRMVHYRQGLSRSIYRKKSLVFNLLPNLVANTIRFVVYKTFRMGEKAYACEGRIMKYWGHLVGKMQRSAESSARIVKLFDCRRQPKKSSN